MTVLWSCQQELLQTEQDYSQKSQQFIIQQLLRAQLEKKDPQLVSKVKQLQIKKPSGNAKIYTDTENGFSVNTDKAILVEDANGNKTYTFKIERNNSSPGFLENLVLEQISDGEYTAYISKYDQIAVQNMGSIAQSDLKNHITFTPLGTKTGTEVFGKYNADPCQVMMPVASSWVQVGGTMCYTGEHDFAHISECNYASNINGYPPTPGYYTYEISYGSVDICGGGGGFTPGNNSGGGTTPIGGGGSGGITFIDFDTPCEKTKNMITNPVVKAKIDEMRDQSKLPYSDPNYGETGYKFDANGVPTPKIIGGKHDVSLGDTAGYLGGYHNHTELGTNMLSPADIIKLLDFSLAQTNGNIEDGYLGMVGSEVCSSCPGGYKYYHYIINFSGNMSELTQYVYNNTWDLKQLKKDYREHDKELADNPLYVNNLGDDLNNQGLEKLFFDTLKNMGMDGKVSLQRIENDGTVKTVTLNNDGNTTTATPCPN
ncbi:hypothetical protein GCM10022217_28670 [Chryseobacterium ginsenosidimutans]